MLFLPHSCFPRFDKSVHTRTVVSFQNSRGSLVEIGRVWWRIGDKVVRISVKGTGGLGKNEEIGRGMDS